MAIDLECLPALESDYRVSDEQAAAFRRDGHILLRGVASPQEVAAYEPVISAAVARFRRETRALADRDTYGKAFLQVTNLWEADPAVRRFTLSRRFASIAARLMGVRGVRLYHDQALFKEPGGGHTPWHQDQFYWPLDTPNTITLWMPLVDIEPSMGPMQFASGSHADGYLEPIAISDRSEDYFERQVKQRGFRLVDGVAMKAGDATFHYGWTLHRAPGNNTGRMREVMTVIYFADGTKLLTPDNDNRQADLERWHPGQQPGELAASKLNPLLYKE
ncbi:MAG: hypothetical protein BIFFINMI_00713 [Phycisphaerae bacterium]|nr:hypothetical protein [Phycisphaerae bacterium]